MALICSWSSCSQPSICGLKSREYGVVINVCREHFKQMKSRHFGTKDDMRHYREQGALL